MPRLRLPPRLATSSTLALLVLGCAFAAVAGPALSLHSRTQAFQQSLDRYGADGNSVQVSATWANLVAEGNDQVLPPSALPEATAEIARALTSVPLPLAAGNWGSLGTRPLNVTAGAAASAQAGAPPKLEVLYRNQLSGYARLVAGSTAAPSGSLGVTVTTQTAARFGLRPGSQLTVQANGPVLLTVTGITSERSAGSTFWTFDPLAGTPSENAPLVGLSYWQGAVFADPGEFTAIQQDFGQYGLQFLWECPISLSAVNADQAPTLLADLNQAQSGPPGLTRVMDGMGTALIVTAPMAQNVAEFTGTQAEVETVLLLLFVSLIVIGADVLLLAARMITVRRADQLAMVRARGGSARQVASLLLRDTAIVVVPAALLGAGLAAALMPRTTGTTAGTTSSGWVLAAIVLLAALAGPPLTAAWQVRKPAPPANPATVISADPGSVRWSWTRRPRLRRVVAEVTACVAAIAGLVVLRDQGVPAAGGIDLFITAVPVLVAVPVAIVLLRLYPPMVRGLSRLASRGSGATAFLGLAQAGRSSLTGVLPASALMLALSLTTFAGMISGAVNRAEVAASWQTTGADVLVSAPANGPPISSAAVRQIASVPGVQATALVWSTTWETDGGVAVSVLAVNPAGYAAVVADTPFPGIDTRGLRGGSTISVIASPGAAALLGRGAATLTNLFQMGPINVRVAGTVSSTPAQLSGGDFILMPLQAVPGPGGQPAPHTLLIDGPDVNDARLADTIAAAVPGASVTFRAAALDSLTGSPLQHGASVMMTLVVAVVGAFGLLILILGLALGAADRQLTVARLATMGHWRPVRLVATEAMPAVVVAVIGGAVCALALPGLVGSAIDLSGFTGASVPVQLRPDLTAFGLPALALLALAAATLIAQTRALRRAALPRLW
jgi:putative ABC transport system permease protein